MKLINLNIWTGKVYEPLVDFINTYKDTADIFCFQEVSKSDRSIVSHETRTNILEDLTRLLPDFEYNFAHIGSGYDLKGKVDFPLLIGQATFIKKDFEIKDRGHIFVYKKQGDMGLPYPDGRGDFPRNFLYDEIEKDGKKFMVLNLHGFWEPAPKYDTPERFKQSEMILDFISKYDHPVILAGDLNLGIETKSLAMLEEKLTNLIKTYNLPTTRSSLYNPYYKVNDLYADYVLTSSGVKVKNFKTLPEEVSDHLALELDFEV